MSETTTATLTGFLLERIAEDEALANDARRLQDYMPSGAWDLDRVVAECAAKRRLLRDPILTDGQRINGEPGIVLEQIMLHLAAIYADHPDFREEWRP